MTQEGRDGPVLKARNLDDQTYQEIVKAAEGRLPWLCPSWTDHNAHDPGITILELMAWYKELQQYQMNQVTDALRRKLLKLVGIYCRPAHPAGCAVELSPQDPPRLAGARLTTQEDIPFELTEAVPAHRPVLARICVEQGERLVDVGEMLGDRYITFQPFAPAEGRRSTLRVGFSALGEGELRLWFDVERPEGVSRNPFASPEQAPRVIRWCCIGAPDTLVVRDDTHALSQSGYVTLRPQGEWPADGEGLHWLKLSLEEAGCEEEVRLSGLSAGRYHALQQETWARTHWLRAPALPQWETCLADAQAVEGELAVFVRTRACWEQTGRWQSAAAPEGRLLRLDTSSAVQDGEDNVMVVSLDAFHCNGLIFDAKGLPGESFFLDLEGRTALRESFTLLCQTLGRDGQVRPELWRCVDDLYQWGPRDRVFVYDPLRETITFGDGAHGALLQGGKGAVLVSQLTLSYCEGGNIPGGESLRFVSDGCPVRNQAASGGTAQEGVLQAQARLLRELSTTRKCVSGEDYERLARQTPGLRVAAAKALPGYDPDEPTGVSRTPTVTVVVVPAGAGECPMPDTRFLETVRRQLDQVRPIGTQVRVVPPAYVALTAEITLWGGEADAEGALKASLRAYLSQSGIGGTLRAGDVAARAQAAPGVLRVRDVSLRAAGTGCYQNSEGDIRLPRQAIPYLKELRVTCLPVERIGR